jgi:hypothetical protein
MAKLASPQPVRIPKGTLRRLTLGQSFAEYDRGLLDKANIFVETPAVFAATDRSRAKCFFVGRRGTGKTALTFHLQKLFPNNSILLLPQLLTPIERFFELEEAVDVHQRTFKSLVASFKRSILDEVITGWVRRGLFSFGRTSNPVFTRERNYIEDYEFDVRLLTFASETLEFLNKNQDKEWVKQISRSKDLGMEMDQWPHNGNEFVVLIDRIDESWDGSDKAVAVLMALMHACIELTAQVDSVRPLVFLRENVFERVRLIDKEFARLETFVVSLEWTREMLLEMVERRLNAPLIAKLPLRGPTWNAYFEETAGVSSQDMVFSFCQNRPRDVLTYCSLAIESAQARKRERIQIEDFQTARQRFSESRLKDLCDEYADNFPQLVLVLTRFRGLGKEFTTKGISDFVAKLLVDDEVKQFCAAWIFRYMQPDLFVRLLYDVGFLGIKKDGKVYYRSAGSESPSPPSLGLDVSLVVHPTYTEALGLQEHVVSNLDSVTLRETGFIGDLPESVDLSHYMERLKSLRDELKALPVGLKHSSEFEDLVGDVIKFCFFRWLTNVQPRARDMDGRVVRDWIAANHATGGFWELVRQRYDATQIIWECKNYEDLDAADFQQASYYMTDAIGRFVIIASRGEEKKKHYYGHIRRIAQDRKGIVGLVPIFESNS